MRHRCMMSKYNQALQLILAPAPYATTTCLSAGAYVRSWAIPATISQADGISSRPGAPVRSQDPYQSPHSSRRTAQSLTGYFRWIPTRDKPWCNHQRDSCSFPKP